MRVTDGFGCVRYDTVSLLVHQLPTVDIGQDTVLCDPGSTYAIRPGDFSSYTWTNSNTNWESEDKGELSQ